MVFIGIEEREGRGGVKEYLFDDWCKAQSYCAHAGLQKKEPCA